MRLAAVSLKAPEVRVSAIFSRSSGDRRCSSVGGPRLNFTGGASTTTGGGGVAGSAFFFFGGLFSGTLANGRGSGAMREDYEARSYLARTKGQRLRALSSSRVSPSASRTFVHSHSAE